MKNKSIEKQIQRIERSIKKWGDPNGNKTKALNKLLNINNGGGYGDTQRTDPDQG